MCSHKTNPDYLKVVVHFSHNSIFVSFDVKDNPLIRKYTFYVFWQWLPCKYNINVPKCGTIDLKLVVSNLLRSGLKNTNFYMQFICCLFFNPKDWSPQVIDCLQLIFEEDCTYFVVWTASLRARYASGMSNAPTEGGGENFKNSRNKASPQKNPFRRCSRKDIREWLRNSWI